MRYKLIVTAFLAASCVSAQSDHAPVLQFSPNGTVDDKLTISSFSVQKNGGDVLLSCKSGGTSEHAVLKNCTIAPGHNLDEAMNAIVDSMKEQSEAHEKEEKTLRDAIDRILKELSGSQYHVQSL